jgi:methylated-DNA-[protein]-cysteine S-methyltransferase
VEAPQTAAENVRLAGHNGLVTSLSWATIETPAGPMSVGCTGLGVAQTRFGLPPTPTDSAGPDHPVLAGTVLADTVLADPVLAAARNQLAEYFARTRTAFDVPLDWGDCTGSRRAVLGLLAETVGYGQTVNYGALAQRLADQDGRPSIGARAIGAIMGSNPIPVIVPCHRVVATDGLGGFSGGCGVELKRWLLTFEGALPAMLDFGPPAGLMNRA